MKKFAINRYYDFLMFLEDVLGGVATIINKHRKKIDEKYWDEYIAPDLIRQYAKSLNKKSHNQEINRT